MFCGQWKIKIQDDGSILSDFSQESFMTKTLLGFKGKKCVLSFDESNFEIVFSFGKSLMEDENITVLSSFITGSDPEVIKKQFQIPKEYMNYYSNKNAFVIGYKDTICISRTKFDASDYDQ